MYRNFPEVFRSGAVVDAQATLVVRCVLSMAAFCERLKELNPRLEVSRTAARRTTRYLNFYSKPTNPNAQPGVPRLHRPRAVGWRSTSGSGTVRASRPG